MHTPISRFQLVILLLVGLLSFSGIAAHAASATVSAGQAVTLSLALNGGTAPFSYKWFKDGSILIGSTSSTYVVTNFQAGNAGVYYAVVANSVSSTTSDTATITLASSVPAAPLITTQPLSQTVVTGTNMTFSAAASGLPAPTYQWQKNGANISGAISASYTISSATSAIAGTYQVIASNSAGSVTSNGALLTVTAAPTTVTIWPNSTVPVLADAGADSLVELGVKFKSDVAGAITGIRFYKSTANTGTHAGHLWSSAGTLLATAIFSSETATGWQQVNFTSPVTIAANTVYVASYSCPAGHYSDDLNYFSTKGADNTPLHALANGVSGSNGLYTYGSSSVFPTQTWNASNYWVDVVFQPAMAITLTSIAVTPTNSAVTVGAAQQFTATATYANATTQNVTSQVTWGSSNPAVATVNATTGLVTTTSAGSSTISATLSGVTATTTLTTQAAALAISTASLPNGLVSSSYSATQAATGGTVPYAWAIASGTLPTGVTLNVNNGALTGTPTTAGTFSFTVRVTDAGNPMQTIAKALTVTVTGAPIFTTQPASQTVTSGTSVTFTAAASGTPAPTYQWRKSGTNISGATAASYTIANVASGSAGTYTVVASNSAGSATSGSATLTVNAATSTPVFTTQPASQTVTSGTSVTFTAAAIGTPAPTYQWRKNGTNISSATAASYTIANVASGSAGTYTLVATNSAGSVTSNGAVLTIAAPTSSKVGLVDFNADGQSDIVWQNVANGQWVVWLMSGTQLNSIVSLGTFSTDLQISRAGDFNADGKVDLLVQNTVTGECSLWLMSGTTVTSKIVLSTESLDWQIRGTGDFNGDGKLDIVWQNTATGQCVVWLMSGTKLSSIVSLGTFPIATEICGVGDFNGDGKSDIVWQNILTGERSIWLMSGTTVTSKVSLGTFSTDWQISGVGDFNGDGMSDLLMQNIVTGECDLWLMSGTTIASKVFLSTEVAAWVIKN